MPQYHAALTKEIEQYYKAAGRIGPLNTIYFGGGTPSTYPDELLLDMFGTLRRVFDFNQDTEVTIEVNPGTVRPGKLELWKSLGINRLSIGVQSLNDKALHELNRHQSARDVFALLDQAKSLFSNISVDVILGLPGVSDQEWKELLHQVVSWPITHVSMYFLTIHEDTPLYFKVKSKKVTVPCDDKMIELYYEARDIFIRNGFEHYEISSFARPGYQSRHNTTYWERVPYKAFGLGACSFDGTRRLQNEKNLMKYMHAVSQAELAPAQTGEKCGEQSASSQFLSARTGDCTMFVEELSDQQIHMERVMLGLRRSKGVTWEIITQGLSESKRAEVRGKVEEFKNKGWMRDVDGVLTLLPAGLALENEIIVQLCG